MNITETSLDDIRTMFIRQRQQSNRSLRYVAGEVGISSSTLNHFEHGGMCTAEHLLTILRWLEKEVGK